MPALTRVAASVVLLAMPVVATSQEVTEVVPLVKEVKKQVAYKYRFGTEGNFTAKGLKVTAVGANSPVRKMSSKGSDSTFSLEPGDIICGIADANGKFFVPNSPAAMAAVMATLPGPQTRILVRDVRSPPRRPRYFVFTTDLINPNAGGGGGGGGQQAGKIVVLLIGATDDGKVGPAVEDALMGIENALAENTQAMHLAQEPVQVTGADVTQAKILAAIGKLAVKPGDTLLCYLNCHGGFDPKVRDYSDGHHFNMADGRVLLRADLRQALEKKGAKLTCLITDACNVYSPLALPEALPYTEAPRNLRFESLFLRPAGFVDITSSKQGQYSFTGIFGPTFESSLSLNGKFAIPHDKATNWKEYADKLGQTADARYRRVRELILKNPATDDEEQKLHKILREQPNQTMKVYELPRN
jgi:hypothetical protein